MAKHKSFKGLGATMIQIGIDIERNTLENIRKAALVTNQVAVLGTPVDTGYARSRWTVSLGDPITSEESQSINLGEEIATSIALAQGEAEIKKWKGQGSIFITNPLHYVTYLDQGTSSQAPQGISDDAIRAGQEALKQLKIVK